MLSKQQTSRSRDMGFINFFSQTVFILSSSPPSVKLSILFLSAVSWPTHPCGNATKDDGRQVSCLLRCRFMQVIRKTQQHFVIILLLFRQKMVFREVIFKVQSFSLKCPEFCLFYQWFYYFRINKTQDELYVLIKQLLSAYASYLHALLQTFICRH